MKLYFNPISTYSQKVLIAFHEKDVAFEPQIVNLGDPTARAEYEKVYPLGKVPFLDVDGDHHVPESTIIIEFLEDRYPGRGTTLIPQGDRELARKVRFMDRMADLYLNDPIVSLLFMKIGLRPHDDATVAKARKSVGIGYQALSGNISQNGGWVCAGGFSMADCATIAPLYYAREVVPFDEHPVLVDYWQRANQRPSVKATFAQTDPVWAAMKAGSQ